MRQQLEKERQRAVEAKQLLDNKYFKEAFEATEKSILDQMEEVSLRDKDMHTTLIMARKNLHAIKRHLLRTIETGEMAKLQLSQPKVMGLFRR